MFSGEESYGKYLDLYTNHTTYNNLKNIGKRIGYLQYLDALLLAENGLIHMDIPNETRLTRDYESWVPQMLLCAFCMLNVLQVYRRSSYLSHVLHAPDAAAGGHRLETNRYDRRVREKVGSE
jgi:hypothetical protein